MPLNSRRHREWTNDDDIDHLQWTLYYIMHHQHSQQQQLQRSQLLLQPQQPQQPQYQPPQQQQHLRPASIISPQPPKGLSPMKRLTARQKEVFKRRIWEMLAEEAKDAERGTQLTIRQKNVAILDALLAEVKSNPTLLKMTSPRKNMNTVNSLSSPSTAPTTTTTTTTTTAILLDAMHVSSSSSLSPSPMIQHATSSPTSSHQLSPTVTVTPVISGLSPIVSSSSPSQLSPSPSLSSLRETPSSSPLRQQEERTNGIMISVVDEQLNGDGVTESSTTRQSPSAQLLSGVSNHVNVNTEDSSYSDPVPNNDVERNHLDTTRTQSKIRSLQSPVVELGEEYYSMIENEMNEVDQQLERLRLKLQNYRRRHAAASWGLLRERTNPFLSQHVSLESKLPISHFIVNFWTLPQHFTPAIYTLNCCIYCSASHLSQLLSWLSTVVKAQTIMKFPFRLTKLPFCSDLKNKGEAGKRVIITHFISNTPRESNLAPSQINNKTQKHTNNNNKNKDNRIIIMANAGAPVQILNDGGFEEKGELAQMVYISSSIHTRNTQQIPHLNVLKWQQQQHHQTLSTFWNQTHTHTQKPTYKPLHAPPPPWIEIHSTIRHYTTCFILTTNIFVHTLFFRLLSCVRNFIMIPPMCVCIE